MNAEIFKGGKLVQVSFPTTMARMIARPVVPLMSLMTRVQLHIHLGQCFLHPLNMGAGTFDQGISLSNIASQDTLGHGTE